MQNVVEIEVLTRSSVPAIVFTVQLLASSLHFNELAAAADCSEVPLGL